MNVCDIQGVVWSEGDIVIERDVLPFGSFFYSIFWPFGGALSAEYSTEVKQINGTVELCVCACVAILTCDYSNYLIHVHKLWACMCNES